MSPMNANRRRFALRSSLATILLAFAAVSLGFFGAASYMRSRLPKERAVPGVPSQYARDTGLPSYFWRDDNTLIFWENGIPKGRFYAIDSRTGARLPLTALTNAVPDYVHWIVPAPDGQHLYYSSSRIVPGKSTPEVLLHLSDLNGIRRRSAPWIAYAQPLPIQNDDHIGRYSAASTAPSRDFTTVPLSAASPAAGSAVASTTTPMPLWGHPAMKRKPWPLYLTRRGDAIDVLAVDLFANASALGGYYNIAPGYAALSFNGTSGAPPPKHREIPLLSFTLHPTRPNPAVRSVSIPLPADTMDGGVQVSPDGRRLAIVTSRIVPSAYRMMQAVNALRRYGIRVPWPKILEQEVFVCNVDGSDMRRVSVGRVGTFPQTILPPMPRWTPDGRSLSFFRETTLYCVDVDK
jgi:hypothetical protein